MKGKVVICGVNTSVLPLLSEEESYHLLTRIKAGDENAREEFIIGNIRLVLSVIKRFWAKKANSDDIFQAGCIGLIKSIDNFDLSVGVKFSTYAVPMIVGEIKRFLRDVNSLRISRSIRDTAYQVLKTRGEIEKNDEEATLEKIAERMNVAVSDVSYDPVFNKAGDTLMIMDQLGDEKNTDENWTEKVALESAMSRLSDREKKILRLRYYEGKTQTEISEEVGISQAQVSRLEKTALKIIKSGIE